MPVPEFAISTFPFLLLALLYHYLIYLLNQHTFPILRLKTFHIHLSAYAPHPPSLHRSSPSTRACSVELHTKTDNAGNSFPHLLCQHTGYGSEVLGTYARPGMH
jgi:hypothetical protein